MHRNHRILHLQRVKFEAIKFESEGVEKCDLNDLTPLNHDQCGFSVHFIGLDSYHYNSNKSNLWEKKSFAYDNYFIHFGNFPKDTFIVQKIEVLNSYYSDPRSNQAYFYKQHIVLFT